MREPNSEREQGSLKSRDAQKSTQNASFLMKIFITALFTICILIFYYTIEVFLLTFAGILFAIFLRSLVSLLKKFIPISEGSALMLVIAMLFGICFFIVSWLAPTISEQISQLIAELPQAWNKIEGEIERHINLKPLLNNAQFKDIFPSNKNLFQQVANFFSTSFGIAGSFLVLIFIGIFLAYHPQPYLEGIIKMTPKDLRSRVEQALKQMATSLRWWLLGRIFSMTVVGLLTSLGLWLLNVPLALTLGLIAMILNFIPNIGPILALIPAVLIALIQSPTVALYVAILYIVIQFVESYIFTPMIQQKALSLPPALIIFAQLIMAVLTGILGLALATPLLAILVILIQIFYIESIVEDKS